MSYILEALADSEQARQQIAAAPKYSLLPVMGEDLPPRRRWPFVLAGALLLNVAVLQIWLRPAPVAAVASTDAATLPPVAQTRLAAPEPGVAPLAPGGKPAADVAGITPPQARPAEALPERASDHILARPSAPADAVPRTVSANSAQDSAPIHLPKLAPKVTAKPGAQPVVATASTPNPTAPTPAGDTAEMPPVLQQEMPALSVAGFIHDEGSGSMVIVNDRLVREGDDVAPGVKLEKIHDDSLVFSYKGYRFKR